ncbi:MAG: hypothetical protein JWN02_634, partial [Acidobacteria bacterium]|nr:hypothetical protein [Acidobacteriota bacterium]
PILLLATLTAHAAPPPPPATTVDPALFQELRWRLLGPFRGGRTLAVCGVPGQPEHFYFGSVNGGVWETRDAGRTWLPLFDRQPIGSIGAIAVAPSNPNVIYVGTGEADMRSDISQGDGMYKSSDGGATWTHIGLADTQQIGRILIDPNDPETVYVAALGHPYGPNDERGVFRSKDGGQTWKKVLARNDHDTGAIDLASEPGNGRILYASLWQTRRTPWSVYPPSNGIGGGLFKSIDGGDNWTEIRGTGLPATPGRIGIAVAPSRPARIYAVVDAPEGGIFRSDDGGASWDRTSSDARVWQRGWYFGELTVEPTNPDVVYSLNVNVFRSDDGGKTFAPVKGAPGGDDYHHLWIDPKNPERRILGSDQGAEVSVNGGRTWSSWFNQPTGQFYHAITDTRFPYFVWGAQQDSGAAGVPSRTNTYSGTNLTQFREITAGGESDNIAPDPKDPDTLFGSRVEKLDLKTMQTQSVDPTLAHPDDERRTWTLPLVFSHRDPSVLYFSNQRLYRTADGGRHWSVISPDLTREDPGTPPNLDAATAALHQETGARRGVVYTIAPSHTTDRELWAGTDDGLIWRTKDEGEHWTNVTPSVITAWSKVGGIEPSYFDGDTAYAAVDRHRLDDNRPYIYRTGDGGKSWQPIVNGIPAGNFVNVVREDPIRKGLLYAGTEKGVYVSFDAGNQWQPLQLNLPVTSVRDIDVHAPDLVIGTHGRGFWAIDDVSALRQLTPEVAGAAAWLYKPADAVRFRPAGFTGTPWPKDEPHAENPPAGAYIDYVLKAAPAKPVTLEIFDEQGLPVRHYSSADPVPPIDPAKLRTAPEWVTPPSVLATTPGMHRFVWPLRYPAAGVSARRSGRSPDGIWAPPGSYKVVLTVDGKQLTQSLTVAPDPRSKLTAADYAEQFALARQIEQTQVRVAAALADAETTLKSLETRRGAGEAAVAEVEARARTLAGIRAKDDTRNTAPLTTTLSFIAATLDKLLAAVDSADAPPTPDAREGYALARTAADTALREWQAFKATMT